MLQDKLREYVDNGTMRGWLIDPPRREVFVYRRDAAPECLRGPAHLSAAPLMAGFRLELQDIW